MNIYSPIENKYTKWYNALVKSRQLMNRKFVTGCGLEKHHIIPKSFGGSNKKENIVIFTPREHCLAHILLTRMYTGIYKAKMCYALIAISELRNKNRSSITTREYEKLRKVYYSIINDEDYKKLRSENTKKQWTPERRAAVSAKAKKQWEESDLRSKLSSNEYKSKKSEQMKDRWKDPEYIQIQSEAAKKQWAEGRFR